MSRLLAPHLRLRDLHPELRCLTQPVFARLVHPERDAAREEDDDERAEGAAKNGTEMG